MNFSKKQRDPEGSRWCRPIIDCRAWRADLSFLTRAGAYFRLRQPYCRSIPDGRRVHVNRLAAHLHDRLPPNAVHWSPRILPPAAGRQRRAQPVPEQQPARRAVDVPSAAPMTRLAAWLPLPAHAPQEPRQPVVAVAD
jgi:hypothetical protein